VAGQLPEVQLKLVMAVVSPLKRRFCRSLASEALTAINWDCAFERYAASAVSLNRGNAIAANIPMTTMTNVNSIIVNAL
jgi:hypothetical protein